MKSKTFPLLALALGLMAQNGQAAELTSGPPTGSPLAPVNSYALHGPHKGQEFDAAKSLGQAPRVLCLAWGNTALIGGTSTGYIFRLPSGQGNWQPLHLDPAGPVYSVGQAPDQIVAGKTAQVFQLAEPAK